MYTHCNLREHVHACRAGLCRASIVLGYNNFKHHRCSIGVGAPQVCRGRACLKGQPPRVTTSKFKNNQVLPHSYCCKDSRRFMVAMWPCRLPKPHIRPQHLVVFALCLVTMATTTTSSARHTDGCVWVHHFVAAGQTCGTSGRHGGFQYSPRSAY